MPELMICLLVGTTGVILGLLARRRFVLASAADFEKRFRAMRFRRLRSEDIEQCLEIYRLNEPGRFPPEMIRQYWRTLTNGTVYTLVLEEEGRVVATGSIGHHPGETGSYLCYGLVHPEFQGQGIGTAMVYARLALLDPRTPKHTVSIGCVSGSIAFYAALGFREVGTWKDTAGKRHPAAHIELSRAEIKQIHLVLDRCGIVFPLEDQGRIPNGELLGAAGKETG